VTAVVEVTGRLDRDDLTDEELRQLLGAAVRAYARRCAARRRHVAPYDPDAVTPTEAARTAAGLLREADVSSFELAMMFNL
jgi:hypothetical protein